MVIMVLIGSPIEEGLSDAPTAEARENGLDQMRGEFRCEVGEFRCGGSFGSEDGDKCICECVRRRRRITEFEYVDFDYHERDTRPWNEFHRFLLSYNKQRRSENERRINDHLKVLFS